MADRYSQIQTVLNLRDTKVGSAARAAKTGNVGGAIRTAADIAAFSTIDKQAKKFAANRKKPVQEKKKKMVGMGFYMVVGVGLIKDFVLDFILNFTLVLVLLVIPLSFLISFIVFVYMYVEGVEMGTRNIVTGLIAFVTEIAPFFSIIPAFTIAIVLVRIFENSEEGKGLLGFVAKRTKKLA